MSWRERLAVIVQRSSGPARGRQSGHTELDRPGNQGDEAAQETPAATAAADGIMATDPAIACRIAEKVLLAWLRNRYQLLFPFALSLERLDGPRLALLLDAMVAAAGADGDLDGQERERLGAALALVDPTGRGGPALAAALAAPATLEMVLRRAEDVETGALVYAGALLVLDRRKPVNRLFVRWLAARLQLPEDLAQSLDRRFHVSG